MNGPDQVTLPLPPPLSPKKQEEKSLTATRDKILHCFAKDPILTHRVLIAALDHWQTYCAIPTTTVSVPYHHKLRVETILYKYESGDRSMALFWLSLLLANVHHPLLIFLEAALYNDQTDMDSSMATTPHTTTSTHTEEEEREGEGEGKDRHKPNDAFQKIREHSDHMWLLMKQSMLTKQGMQDMDMNTHTE